MTEPILRVEALTKYFGGLRAVHIDLAIEEGELRCLIGPNGAGKSTLFRMLCGSARPSGGRVWFRGRDITGRDPFASPGWASASSSRSPASSRNCRCVRI
jgi:branched-chain amino acid transport system ATP-binding protein